MYFSSIAIILWIENENMLQHTMTKKKKKRKRDWLYNWNYELHPFYQNNLERSKGKYPKKWQDFSQCIVYCATGLTTTEGTKGHGDPINGLGDLESTAILSHVMAFGALECTYKMALKMGAP